MRAAETAAFGGARFGAGHRGRTRRGQDAARRGIPQGSKIDAMVVLQGEPYGAAVPYLPLREPLRGLLGVTETDRAQAGVQAVKTIGAMVPGLGGLAPLLAPVLDVEIAPTPESAAIADDFVRDRLAALVVAVLAIGGRRGR